MKPQSKSCTLCHGSRHRYDEKRGGYVKCECLMRKRLTQRYRRAGVPKRLASGTWSQVIKAHKFTGRARPFLTAVGKRPPESLQRRGSRLLG